MTEALTIGQIAARSGITRQHLWRRLREVQALPESTDKRRLYSLESLPDDIKARLALAESAPQSAPLSEAQKAGAVARAELLALLDKAPRGLDKYLASYNAGEVRPDLLAQLGPVSRGTVYRWRREASAEGVYALADRRRENRLGKSVITREQAEILLKVALAPNHKTIAEIIRYARGEMAGAGEICRATDKTLANWLAKWRSLNYDQWVFYRQGEAALNDKVMYYLRRDHDRIEVGDILVADGHVLNFEIVNPWTGKPKRMMLILWLDMKSMMPLGWEIMPTESTKAIASAFRRAIMFLGKIPRVVYLDNGKAFGAKYFDRDISKENFAGLFTRLGVEGVIHAWPYHGQSKTIERFFGIFSELEKICPSYSGTSIATKPPRMLRGEKLHRAVYEKAFPQLAVSYEQAHRAIAGWFDIYAKRPHQAGKLKGLTSWEIFEAGRGPGVDQRLLDDLMLEAKKATVTRAGIKLMGREYWAPELYGRRHPVTVRYDLQDASYIKVYDDDGRYMCDAHLPPGTHPSAACLGNDEDRELLKSQIELKNSLKKRTTAGAREFLEKEILPAHRRQHLALVGDAEAAEEPPALPAAGLTPGAAEIIEEQAAKMVTSQTEFSPDSERWLFLSLESYGGEISTKEVEWMRWYEESDEGRALMPRLAEELLRRMS